MYGGTRGDCPCGQLHMQVRRLGHQAGQILLCSLIMHMVNKSADKVHVVRRLVKCSRRLLNPRLAESSLEVSHGVFEG